MSAFTYISLAYGLAFFAIAGFAIRVALKVKSLRHQLNELHDEV